MANREGLVVMSVNVIPEGLDESTRVRVVVIGLETEFWVELRVAPAEGAESGG